MHPLPPLGTQSSDSPGKASSSSSSSVCDEVPQLIHSFVDAFVDHAVSGIFFPLQPIKTTTVSNTIDNRNTAPTFLPSPDRLVAIGDLHGDLPKSLSALSLAGVLDPSTLRWSGEPSTIAVQVGDVLDRGPDELRLLYLLHRLKLDASRSSSLFLTLIGNHEVMNLSRDFRYVHPAALSDFARWEFWYRAGLSLKSLCPSSDSQPPPPDPFRGIPRRFPGVPRVHWPGVRARIAALRPDGGPITSRFLSRNPAVVVVGDTVFVHGGLLENHVQYGLERINSEAMEWMEGRRGGRPPEFLKGRDSVVWLRRFSHGPGGECDRLAAVLAGIPGAPGRMVMGHTIQKEGVNAVCGDRAVRIDVGLSRGCGDGLPEVLEILRGGREVRVLTSRRPYEDERKGLALLLGGLPQQVDVKA